MCDLCSKDEKELRQAQQRCKGIAKSLRRMADGYEQMERGIIKPHTDEAQNLGGTAFHIVRELVSEWV